MYPKNTWYVAATSDELGEAPLGRTICGETIVFHRDADGRVVALDDFCPHRGARLSLGKVCGGNLVCGYHGLQVGPDGKVVSMPGQRVGGFPAVPSFPVVERDGFVWLWPGDPAKADAKRIPRLVWANAQDRSVLESQQQNLSRHPERRLLKLNIDAGGVQSRRLIDAMIASETAAQPDRAARRPHAA